MEFKFNSVVFNSSRLPELRAFYEGKLGFLTGTFEKNGERLPDFSDSYVNYHVGGGLIGFETDGAEMGVGDIILSVSNFDGFREKVKSVGVPIVRESNFYFMINDPEGRTLIFER